ncbi:nucleotidyltransferase family protein [Mesorhizobium koreense]|uniref:nucleotidyltransferase family protein n=1 Tax=Mesorhizobium koreense TaxID=3074855 RepID=UPI00287BBA96|nr:nucleotidyltransferase family protein [Mesorhizobium sp. WR6]
MSTTPLKAMVLAAGLGTRMRPLTEKTPKPLIEVGGKPLIDWGLDSLERAGVSEAIVNIHHLPDQMRAHLAKRAVPCIVISDETDQLLESGGGIVRALPLLGREPFFVLNADTFWVDDGAPSLSGLALAWDGARMDILLMLAEMGKATGHSGRSDFLFGADGRLARSKGDPAGLIYAGAAIVHPRIFAGAEAEPHSLNRYFDLAAAEGRLFGWRMRGRWITVGTPEAIPASEAAVVAASVS